MISAVICMSLRWVWHLCNLPCVSVLFCLISIARYVFKSPSIWFWGTRYDVYCERVSIPCILYRDASPGFDRTVSRTVGRFLSRVSYLPSYIFFGDAVALLWESYTLVQRNSCVSSYRRSQSKSRVYFRWVACICTVSDKNKPKFRVTFRSLTGLFNWLIRSDKSGWQAKTVQNVAGGNFTRGFAAREIPRGLCPRGNMAALPPLARSQIPPATQATFFSAGVSS